MSLRKVSPACSTAKTSGVCASVGGAVLATVIATAAVTKALRPAFILSALIGSGCQSDRRDWRLARQNGGDVVERQKAHGVTRFDGGAGDVRREKDVWQRRQPPIEVRLAAIDVQPGGEEVAGLARFDQGIFVDERAARRVYENRTARQEREGFAGHQRAVAAGQMKRENLAARQQILETRDVFGALLAVGGKRRAIVVEHTHVEAARAAGDRLADAPHAHDAEDASARAQAEIVRHAEGLAPSLAHDRAVLRKPAAGREDQQKGEVGSAIGQHSRGVGDDKAMLAGGLHVHVVKAGARICDDANAVGQIRNIGRGEPNLWTAEHGLASVLGRCTDDGIRIHVDVRENGVEFALRSRRHGWRNATGDQQTGLRAHWRAFSLFKRFFLLRAARLVSKDHDKGSRINLDQVNQYKKSGARRGGARYAG